MNGTDIVEKKKRKTRKCLHDEHSRHMQLQCNLMVLTHIVNIPWFPINYMVATFICYINTCIVNLCTYILVFEIVDFRIKRQQQHQQQKWQTLSKLDEYLLSSTLCDDFGLGQKR